jgi:uncharacterized protein (DUF1697 family)
MNPLAAAALYQHSAWRFHMASIGRRATVPIMTRFVALIRAVNVGGTGHLPMAKLKAMCVDAGFERIETYIASGNLVFDSATPVSKVKAELERRLHEHAGKPVGVLIRSAAEMAAILKTNPFEKSEPKFTHVVFLDRAPPKDWGSGVSGQADEEIKSGKREMYVHYPSGMGRSKLKIRAAASGTARNLNTVRKLAEMASR